VAAQHEWKTLSLLLALKQSCDARCTAALISNAWRCELSLLTRCYGDEGLVTARFGLSGFGDPQRRNWKLWEQAANARSGTRYRIVYICI